MDIAPIQDKIQSRIAYYTENIAHYKTREKNYTEILKNIYTDEWTKKLCPCQQAAFFDKQELIAVHVIAISRKVRKVNFIQDDAIRRLSTLSEKLMAIARGASRGCLAIDIEEILDFHTAKTNKKLSSSIANIAKLTFFTNSLLHDITFIMQQHVHKSLPAQDSRTFFNLSQTPWKNYPRSERSYLDQGKNISFIPEHLQLAEPHDNIQAAGMNLHKKLTLNSISFDEERNRWIFTATDVT